MSERASERVSEWEGGKEGCSRVRPDPALLPPHLYVIMSPCGVSARVPKVPKGFTSFMDFSRNVKNRIKT